MFGGNGSVRLSAPTLTNITYNQGPLADQGLSTSLKELYALAIRY